MNANYYKSRLIELLLNEDGTWGELTESLLKLNFPKEEMDELLNKQYIWPKKDCYWINWEKLGSKTDYWEREYKKLEKEVARLKEIEKNYNSFVLGIENATKYLQAEDDQFKVEHNNLVDKYHHLTGEYNKVLIELEKAKDTILELRYAVKYLYKGLDELYLSGLSEKQIAVIEQLQNKADPFVEMER